jgi:hypothetical protein
MTRVELFTECRIVQFLDESQDIRSQYDSDYSPLEATPAEPGFSPGPVETYTIVDNEPVSRAAIITPTEGISVLSMLNSDSPTEPHFPHFPVPSLSDGSTSVSQPDGAQNFVYQQPPNAPVLWPLANEQEAMLLQHYIHHVALFVCSISCFTYSC